LRSICWSLEHSPRVQEWKAALPEKATHTNLTLSKANCKYEQKNMTKETYNLPWHEVQGTPRRNKAIGQHLWSRSLKTRTFQRCEGTDTHKKDTLPLMQHTPLFNLLHHGSGRMLSSDSRYTSRRRFSLRRFCFFNSTLRIGVGMSFSSSLSWSFKILSSVAKCSPSSPY
jgi:hypothetical protein